MTDPDIRWVLLYRTAAEWRFSVGEFPENVASGILPDTPLDAPAEAAQRDVRAHLAHGWPSPDTLTWRQTSADSWAAVPLSGP
ncbi:hypothetical protein GCM10009827_049750 [Dactylosporangium maewongense]|uniref:Uncharacterized protein n=1 Tax=Dactylosporangium maewongense TaxID=634393 RepID=A0ABN2ATL5_9ACTN